MLKQQEQHKQEDKQLYNQYSSYLKSIYNQKVYKLPVSLKASGCPNRDGNISYGGCTYCGEEGVGFENLSAELTVEEQLLKNKEFITKKYKASKFIAYFQSYSNTYMPFDLFKKYVNQVLLVSDIVEISISTRPDCINSLYLDFLKEFKEASNINITIELGLQTSNYKSLNKINRGHTLAEYIEACNLIKSYDFDICTHVILNLPWDTIEDTIETAKIISVLKSDSVKLHALYIEKNTALAKQYLNNEFTMLPLEDYILKVVTFLEYLSPDIAIQRLIGRAPEEFTLFSNWGMSWWKIKDLIEEKMIKEGRYQGRLFNYKGGKPLEVF
ncbi:MAG: TIGR01212 family radical SAM protein [bacterium]